MKPVLQVRYELERFFVFAAIGALATALHYLILWLWVAKAGRDSVVGSALGFVLSSFVNYALNYRYTFRSRQRHLDAIARFFSVSLVGLSLNTAIMALATALKVHYLVAQVGATAVVLFWNYAGSRLWAFRPKATWEHG